MTVDLPTTKVLDHIADNFRVIGDGRATGPRGLLAPADRRRLIRVLTSDIYLTYHAMADESVALHVGDDETLDVVPDGFTPAFRRAEYADRGWSQVPGAGSTFRKNRDVLFVPQGRLVGEDGGRSILGLPCERLNAVPKCYLRIGPLGPPPEQERVRVYIHAAPEWAHRVYQEICLTLDRKKTTYVSKVFKTPFLCDRADNIVFDVHEDSCGSVVESIGGSARLRPQVPGFARRVCPGVGTAEIGAESDYGMSFGQARAWLAARGLDEAFRSSPNRGLDRSDRIRASFTDAGVDPDEPWRRLVSL